MHNNGKADEHFAKEYGDNLSIRLNNKLPTNFDTVTNAIQTVYNLIDFIDKELITMNLVNKRR